MFCEPASAASVAGLLKSGVERGSTVVCVLTGHGLKDPDIAIGQIAGPTAGDARRPGGPGRARPLNRTGCRRAGHLSTMGGSSNGDMAVRTSNRR